MANQEAPPDWNLFSIADLASQVDDAGFRTFLKVPALSLGLYRIPAGSKDMQSPHDDDEVYYVLEGKARVQVLDEVRDVSPGDLLYVRATEKHHFFEIEEDMLMLVFFANG